MAKKQYYYNVKNRSATTVLYKIPEDNIRRRFTPGETKRISYEELLHLSYQPGGRELMANFLQIMEDKVNDSLGVHRENEYYMNEQQIIDLLKNGSIPAFEDCLDFAPIGVIDLVKRFAIDLPLTDTLKIRILKDKTGFDVEKALVNSEEDKVAESIEKKTETEKPAQTGRRTNTNYKVVTKNS